MKKGRQGKFGALKEISDAAILYTLSTVYTKGLYESFRENLYFLGACADLSCSRKFAQGIESQ